MRVSILFLLGGCLAAGFTQAQSFRGVGLRLGGNLGAGSFNTLEYLVQPGVDYSYGRSALPGFQVGVAATFGRGHWAVQPGLVFTQKGLKQHFSESATDKASGYAYRGSFNTSSHVNYLELPLNVVYSLGAKGEGLQLFAGPFLAVGVGGRASFDLELVTTDPSFESPHTEDGTTPMLFGNRFSNDPPASTPSVDYEARARHIDAGLNFGVGYRRGPVQAQLGYGLGLLNVQPGLPTDYQPSPDEVISDKGYLRTAQLTITYYFPLGGR